MRGTNMSLLEKLEQQKSFKSTAGNEKDDTGGAIFDEYGELKDKIHKEIIEIINLNYFGGTNDDDYYSRDF